MITFACAVSRWHCEEEIKPFRRREMGKPVVDVDTCVGCGSCEADCPAGAIKVDDDGHAVVDTDACVECLACIDNCPAGAITEGE